MTLDTITALRAHLNPTDREAALADLLLCMSSVQKSWRQFMFGFTHPAIAQGIIGMVKRGIDVRIILDHLQYLGHVETGVIHGLIMQGLPPENICICTSMLRQYMHLKRSAGDGDVVVPDAQYPTFYAALEAHYPFIIDGSTNWSESGFKQCNSFLLIPSRVLASETYAAFDEQFAWGLKNESAYQLPSSV